MVVERPDRRAAFTFIMSDLARATTSRSHDPEVAARTGGLMEERHPLAVGRKRGITRLAPEELVRRTRDRPDVGTIRVRQPEPPTRVPLRRSGASLEYQRGAIRRKIRVRIPSSMIRRAAPPSGDTDQRPWPRTFEYDRSPLGDQRGRRSRRAARRDLQRLARLNWLHEHAGHAVADGHQKGG